LADNQKIKGEIRRIQQKTEDLSSEEKEFLSELQNFSSFHPFAENVYAGNKVFAMMESPEWTEHERLLNILSNIAGRDNQELKGLKDRIEVELKASGINEANKEEAKKIVDDIFEKVTYV